MCRQLLTFAQHTKADGRVLLDNNNDNNTPQAVVQRDEMNVLVLLPQIIAMLRGLRDATIKTYLVAVLVEFTYYHTRMKNELMKLGGAEVVAAFLRSQNADLVRQSCALLVNWCVCRCLSVGLSAPLHTAVCVSCLGARHSQQTTLLLRRMPCCWVVPVCCSHRCLCVVDMLLMPHPTTLAILDGRSSVHRYHAQIIRSYGCIPDLLWLIDERFVALLALAMDCDHHLSECLLSSRLILHLACGRGFASDRTLSNVAALPFPHLGYLKTLALSDRLTDCLPSTELGVGVAWL